MPYRWTKNDFLHVRTTRPTPYPTDPDAVNQDLNARGLSPFLFLPEVLPGCDRHQPGDAVWLRLQRSPMPYTVNRYVSYSGYSADIDWQLAPTAASGAVTLGDLCEKMLALSHDTSFPDQSKYFGLYDDYQGGDAQKEAMALKIFEYWGNTNSRYILTEEKTWSWELVKTPRKIATLPGKCFWRVPTRNISSREIVVPVPPKERTKIKVPKDRRAFEGCNTAQTAAIKSALVAAHNDLVKAKTELSQPSRFAQDALWLAFRDNSASLAKSVAEDLDKIDKGLPTAKIQCEQAGTTLACDADALGVTTLPGYGNITVCTPAGDDELNEERLVRVLIHEGAHRFLSKLGGSFDLYFDPEGLESEMTWDAVPWARKLAADAFRAVTYHIAHRTPQEVQHLVEVYSGRAARIGASSPSPSHVNPNNRPSFAKEKFFALDVPRSGFGFDFQWQLVDSKEKIYAMEAGDPALVAAIPAETRQQLLAARPDWGIVRCLVTIKSRPGEEEYRWLQHRVLFDY